MPYSRSETTLYLLIFAQVLVRLMDLMSKNRFDANSSFLHVVTLEEEAQLSHDP